MVDLYKFPSTPHLLWLGDTPVRDDKIMSEPEARAFMQKCVVVEEKVDGANVGVSFDSDARLLIQNRGTFLHRETRGQFAPLWRWIGSREEQLFDRLSNRLILFGEWCYARHSIRYTRLPDWFLAFDVFDKQNRRFFHTEGRDALCAEIEVAVVPTLVSGVFALDEVPPLIGTSTLYDGPMEGIYLRTRRAESLEQRAKVVRAEFTQQIGEHWAKQQLIPNKLGPPAWSSHGASGPA